MPEYRRAHVPGGTYFFTVALAERSKTTLVDHIDLLRAAVRNTRKVRPFTIDAMVVVIHQGGIFAWPSAQRAEVGEPRIQTRARHLATPLLGTPDP